MLLLANAADKTRTTIPASSAFSWKRHPLILSLGEPLEVVPPLLLLITEVRCNWAIWLALSNNGVVIFSRWVVSGHNAGASVVDQMSYLPSPLPISSRILSIYKKNKWRRSSEMSLLILRSTSLFDRDSYLKDKRLSSKYHGLSILFKLSAKSTYECFLWWMSTNNNQRLSFSWFLGLLDRQVSARVKRIALQHRLL